MAEDDLSQRLWREGAREEQQGQNIAKLLLESLDPTTAEVLRLQMRVAELEEEIECLKEEVALKQELFQEQVEFAVQLQDLLGHINLHTADDAFFVQKMDLDERRLYADAVDAWSARLHAGEEEPPGKFERWWEDDYIGPYPRRRDVYGPNPRRVQR